MLMVIKNVAVSVLEDDIMPNILKETARHNKPSLAHLIERIPHKKWYFPGVRIINKTLLNSIVLI